MKTLLLTLALIASIHAETWNCSSIITGFDDDKTVYQTASTLVLKGTSLTLSIKGMVPRNYRFLRDSLEGYTFFTLIKGKGMLMIDGTAPESIPVIDSDVTYSLVGCVAQ